MHLNRYLGRTTAAILIEPAKAWLVSSPKAKVFSVLAIAIITATLVCFCNLKAFESARKTIGIHTAHDLLILRLSITAGIAFLWIATGLYKLRQISKAVALANRDLRDKYPKDRVGLRTLQNENQKALDTLRSAWFKNRYTSGAKKALSLKNDFIILQLIVIK